MIQLIMLHNFIILWYFYLRIIPFSLYKQIYNFVSHLFRYAEQAFGREQTHSLFFLIDTWLVFCFFKKYKHAILLHQFLSSMTYEISKIKLAVSTATCRPLSLAVKQSKVKLLAEATAPHGRQVCGAKGC